MRLRERFPDETWPGDLAHWAQAEEESPELFTSMYQLWCEKVAKMGNSA